MPKKIVLEAVLLLLVGAVLGPHMVGTIQDDQTKQLTLGFLDVPGSSQRFGRLYFVGPYAGTWLDDDLSSIRSHGGAIVNVQHRTTKVF